MIDPWTNPNLHSNSILGSLAKFFFLAKCRLSILAEDVILSREAGKALNRIPKAGKDNTFASGESGKSFLNLRENALSTSTLNCRHRRWNCVTLRL